MELSTAELDQYRQIRDDYRDERALYEKEVNGLLEVMNFIVSTISRHNLMFILDKETPYAMLTALKKRLAPTKMELGRQYTELKNAPAA